MWPMKLFHIQTKIFHFFTQILIALQLRQPNFCNLKTLPVKLRQRWNRIFKMQLLEHLIIKSDSSGQKRTHVVLLAGGITFLSLSFHGCGKIDHNATFATALS